MPVQLWAPKTPTNPIFPRAQADLEAAFRLWQGEIRIYFHDFCDQTRRFVTEKTVQDVGLPQALVPGQELRILDVVHIDEQLGVWPPVDMGPDVPELNRVSASLYQQWADSRLLILRGRKSFRWRLPAVRNGELAWEDFDISMPPGPVADLIAEEGDEGLIKIRFGSGLAGRPTVSLELEQLEQHGNLRWEEDHELSEEWDVVVSQDAPDIPAIYLTHRWPSPFDVMFPFVGLDILHSWGTMQIALENIREGRTELALKAACEVVESRTAEVGVELCYAWFLPKLSLSPQEALMALENRFGLVFSTLDKVFQSAEAMRLLSTPIPVRRVVGWDGYLWWRLYEDLQSGMGFGVCRRCGQPLIGVTSARRFCSRAENEECYLARRAASQRERYKRTRNHT